MPYYGQIIDIWRDALLDQFYDANGNLTGALPSIKYGELVLLRLRYCNGGFAVPFDLTNVAAYGANADNNFNDTGNLAMIASTSDINKAGDWASGGTADPAKGQCSIRLNAAQLIFLTKIGTDRELVNCRWETQGADSSGNKIFEDRFPIRLLGSQNIGDIPQAIALSGIVVIAAGQTQSDPITVPGLTTVTGAATVQLQFTGSGVTDVWPQISADTLTILAGGTAPTGGWRIYWAVTKL